MKLFSVAIGTNYEREAQRLQRCVSLPVEVFTSSDVKYKKINEDPLIDGLWHKANFANYIDEANGPVIFMDADMFTLKTNPFEGFQVPDNMDMAYVCYSGRWWLPDTIRQEAYDFHGHKINSGFMWFKDLETAKKVCNQWQHEYLERVKLYNVQPNISKHEYDEWALMIALMKLDVKKHFLDKKWNDWELNTEDEIRSSDSVFFQSHNHLDIVQLIF